MRRQKLLMFPEAVVDFFEIQPSADGGADDGEADGEVIPPEVVDDVHAGEDAQSQHENDEAEEDGCQN